MTETVHIQPTSSARPHQLQPMGMVSRQKGGKEEGVGVGGGEEEYTERRRNVQVAGVGKDQGNRFSGSGGALASRHCVRTSIQQETKNQTMPGFVAENREGKTEAQWIQSDPQRANPPGSDRGMGAGRGR